MQTGYSEVWLNPSNDYAHRHLHKAGDRMCELAYEFRNEKDPIKIRALNQAARELVLAQSSDWLFIITNGTMVEYAHKAIKERIGRFTKLYYELKKGKINEKFLSDIEKKDDIFPEMNYQIYI